jgi:hypothetical protein
MRLSSFLDQIYEKTKKITSKKSWLAVLAFVCLIVIFTNGIALDPAKDYQKLSVNPFVTRSDINSNNYWQETVLLPVIAFFTRMNSPLTFSILCFAILIGAYILFSGMVFKRFGSFPALIFTSILIASPLTTILLSWLGTADGLTFLLTIPFLYTGSAILIFILAILGTMNHIAFLIAAIEILVLRLMARENIKIIHLAAITSGGIIGLISVKVFLAVYHIQVESRLSFIFTVTLVDWAKKNLAAFPMTIYSLFNIFWLIIPICLFMFFNKDRRYYFFIFAILAFNYSVTFFSLDTTRIFSLLSWGVLIHCIFHSFELADKEDPSYKKQFLQALIVIGAVSLIAPRYYAWAGAIHTTPFYVFLRYGIK